MATALQAFVILLVLGVGLEVYSGCWKVCRIRSCGGSIVASIHYCFSPLSILTKPCGDTLWQERGCILHDPRPSPVLEVSASTLRATLLQGLVSFKSHPRWHVLGGLLSMAQHSPALFELASPQLLEVPGSEQSKRHGPTLENPHRKVNGLRKS